MYISTHQALLDFCQRAREFDAIAVDTEFLRERTFHPRLCLVQIATPAESVAVDPLVIDDLSPLAELMADESVTKVFHACSQDMEVMLHTVGVLPRPIFDTQVAAAFLGERQQVSYGALVQAFCGVSLPKTESLTDWSRRPLTDKQIEYAIDDVKYLIVAYTEMMSRLRELGRVDWVLDELRPLADESHYRADRHEAFRKVKRINSCSRHQLGIAREQVLAMGDSGNDCAMLRYAGVGAAMGNAGEQAKKAADVIAPSNREDGVAWMLRRAARGEV